MLDTLKGETRTPEFLKINPQHTVPVLVDDGATIVDGHAIAPYLVSKYGGAEHASLVPTDPLGRARLDHRLHFNDSTLFARFGKLVGPIFRGNATKFEDEAVESVREAIDVLEIFLTEFEYVAANHLTVADFAIVSMVTTILAIVKQLTAPPKVAAWIKRLEALPFYDEVQTSNLKTIAETFAAKTG